MSRVVIDQPEPPISSKAMVTALYDQIMFVQNREQTHRLEVAEGVSAGNSGFIGVANMHWQSAKSQLAVLYTLWNIYTGEEFKP